ETGGGREDDVRRGGAQHDQVEFGCLDTRGFQSVLGGAEGQVAGGLAIGRDVPLANAGAGADPFVAGIDDLFQIGIGDNALGQGTAGSDDAGVDLGHSVFHRRRLGVGQPAGDRRSLRYVPTLRNAKRRVAAPSRMIIRWEPRRVPATGQSSADTAALVSITFLPRY